MHGAFSIPIREQQNMEKRIGRQEPTIHFALPYEKTDGADAVSLYELTMRTALEWQQILVKDILARNDAGLWVHTRFGYSVPRQNGKGEILAIRELYGLATGERVLHTAHLTATSHKAWERLCSFLDSLNITYKSIKAKGQELIELTDGGRVEFRTRTAKGGLGESYDLLIVDEAQEYTIEQESALKYVISASPNPQIVMCGTPPTPISSGTVFKDFRNDVLSGHAEDAGWAEWSVSEMSDVDNKELWYETNPSLGIRLTERTLSAETGKTEDKKIDFNIQRLGLWIKHNLQSAILKSDWDKLLVEALPKFKGRMNAGVKFSKDGETVTLAIALKTEDDRIFIEVIDNRMVRDGIDWIVAFLKKARNGINKIVIDGANGKEILNDALKAEKLKGIVLASTAQVIKANAAFEQNMFDGRLCRMEQPTLTAVATNCEKRAIGSNGGFGYRSTTVKGDISILDAVLLAAWATDEFTEPRIQKISY